MGMKMTKADRISKIIAGTQTPETIEENLLLEFYKDALVGHSLAELVTAMMDEFEKLRSEALRMVVYGYAIGQRHYQNRLEEYDASNLPNDDDTVH